MAEEPQILDGKLVESIKVKELGNLAEQYANIDIGSVIDKDIYNLPIVAFLAGVVKTGFNIHDRLYIKKVAYFLHQIGQTTQEQREAFIEKYCGDTKRFEEAILLILEQADSMEKSCLIGKVFRACILGEISYEDALKLSTMVNKAFWGDLKQLIETENLSINEYNQSLVMAGLFIIAPSSSLGNRGRYSFGGVKYEITYYGKKLVAISNS